MKAQSEKLGSDIETVKPQNGLKLYKCSSCGNKLNTIQLLKRQLGAQVEKQAEIIKQIFQEAEECEKLVCPSCRSRDLEIDEEILTSEKEIDEVHAAAPVAFSVAMEDLNR